MSSTSDIFAGQATYFNCGLLTAFLLANLRTVSCLSLDVLLSSVYSNCLQNVLCHGRLLLSVRNPTLWLFFILFGDVQAVLDPTDIVATAKSPSGLR